MSEAQGCAAAAAMCALQQEMMSCNSETSVRPMPAWQPLKFALLCSGYPSPVPEHVNLLERITKIQMPSLHISGSDERDSQMSKANACALADLFSSDSRLVLHHEGGHTVPSNRLLVTHCKDFLVRAMCEKLSAIPKPPF